MSMEWVSIVNLSNSCVIVICPGALHYFRSYLTMVESHFTQSVLVKYRPNILNCGPYNWFIKAIYGLVLSQLTG